VDRYDAAAAVGLVAAIAGVAMLSVPAALIVAGLTLVGAGTWGARWLDS
jgi:hypothetical protein